MLRLALAPLALLLVGCAAAPLPPPHAPPFRFALDASTGQGIRPVETPGAGPLGYDPSLPGHRFARPIARMHAVPTGAPLPSRYVLAFVPEAHVALERLEVAGSSGRVETFLGATEETVTEASGQVRRVPAGTYVTLAVEQGEVRATLHPPALALLARGGTVAWVNVHR